MTASRSKSLFANCTNYFKFEPIHILYAIYINESIPQWSYSDPGDEPRRSLAGH